jgi:hypothetical protein
VKIAIAILALLVTALSVIPCCAFDGAEERACLNDQHSEHQHECSVCSPFFSCATCPGFTISTPKYVLPDKPALPVKVLSLYSNYFASSYFSKFWQPPKLA